MFAEERHVQILNLLAADGKVYVKDLAERFGVTEDSIRKDLSALESGGRLKRTYGGAVSLQEKLQMTEANKRRVTAVDAKRKIASAAVRLMRPNDLIFLDISTISIAVAEILEHSNLNLRILTNMIDVLVMLSRNPKINLIFAGGQINLSRDGFSDPLALDFLAHFRPDAAFLGAFGVDIANNALTSRDTSGGMCKAQLINSSKAVYVMAESRKIGTQSTFRFAGFEKVTAIITEASTPALLSTADKFGVKIITA